MQFSAANLKDDFYATVNKEALNIFEKKIDCR